MIFNFYDNYNLDFIEEHMLIDPILNYFAIPDILSGAVMQDHRCSYDCYFYLMSLIVSDILFDLALKLPIYAYDLSLLPARYMKIRSGVIFL